MKRRILYALVLAVFVSTPALAGSAISPQQRINIWTGPYSFPDSKYTIGTTSAMGTIRTLKSDGDVAWKLQNYHIASNTGGLDFTRAPGASLAPYNWSPFGNHQRLNDKYTTSGECVAFARSMTGTKTTNFWYQGSSLTDYVDFYGKLRTDRFLAPGTMIAYFVGNSQYPQNPSTPETSGHVAIFLRWITDANGYVTAAEVVDQNLVGVVSIGGTNYSEANGLIQKHLLTWSCPSGQTCSNTNWKYNFRYIASKYHVVNVL